MRRALPEARRRWCAAGRRALRGPRAGGALALGALSAQSLRSLLGARPAAPPLGGAAPAWASAAGPGAGATAGLGAAAGCAGGGAVDTLIFDIDDTLYPASCGFSEHRMREVTRDLMVERLGFESPDEAQFLWKEYIWRFHSTLKGLKVAEEDGRLPRPFRQEEVGEFWAERCAFERYLRPDPALSRALRSLRDEANMTLVAFTNAPRVYGLRVLEALGLSDLFPGRQVFAVEDVLPACKPEREAFAKVLAAVGARPERCVMFEDSMKNVRACGNLGIRAVLIQERAGADAGEAELMGDAAAPEDPAVCAVLRRVGDLRAELPELWEGRLRARALAA